MRRQTQGGLWFLSCACAMTTAPGACRPMHATEGASTAQDAVVVASVDCPKDLESLGRMRFEAQLGLDGETANNVRDAIAALNEVRLTVSTLDAQITTVCDRVTGELGAPHAPSASPIEACTPAIQAVAKDVSAAARELHSSATTAVTLGCGFPTHAMSECVGKCMTGESDVEVRTECESGQRFGVCGGTCSGTCNSAVPAACGGECTGRCAGDFSGHCEGSCVGKCDGKASKGAACAGVCAGTCDGTARGWCATTCVGACRSSAPMACAGTCVGNCSAPLKDEVCVGWLNAPYGSDACNGRCTAWLFPRVQCVGGLKSEVSAISKDAAVLVQLGEVAPLVSTSVHTALQGLDALIAAGRSLGSQSGGALHIAATTAALAQCVAPALREAETMIARVNRDVELMKSLRQSLALPVH